MLPTPTPAQEILSVIPSVSQIPVWFSEVAKWVAVIAGIVTGVISVVKLIARPLKSIDRKIDTVNSKVDSVDKKVDVVQDDVADIQCHLLNQAYDDHVENKGWCSRDEKDRLSDMCDKYTNRGHNHLREQYAETLLKLPEKPPARRAARKKAPAAAGQVHCI